MSTNPPVPPVRGRLRLRVGAILASHWLPLGVAIVGMALAVPSVFCALFGDDYYHWAAITGEAAYWGGGQSPREAFVFLDGPEQTHRMMDTGFMPWWAYPDMKAAFWRPLTVLTHRLDYRLWPKQPWIMHVHSIAWYGAMLVVVAWMYRRLMPVAWVAGLAALMYAIDDAHGMPIAFLANRNTLISVLFGMLALIAHDTWRRGGRRWAAIAGPLMLLLSLLAKEEGVSTCAFVFAYAAVLDSGPRAKRVASLLPYVVVVIAWRVVWAQLGYGVANLGFYVDPLREPVRYLGAVIERVPYLLLGQWATPPAEMYIMENFVGATFIRAMWWAGVALAAGLCLLLYPLLRRDRLARFWTVGMLLSFVPACSTFPADRMLMFVGLGAMGLIAQLLAAAFGPVSDTVIPALRRRPARVACGFLIVMHLVLAPVAFPRRAKCPPGPKGAEKFLVRTPLDAGIVNQDVVILNPPSLLYATYFPLERRYAGLPAPRRVRFLGSGLARTTVHRPDEHSLVIGIDGGYINWSFERLFRDARFPMKVGDRVVLTGMTATVTAVTADGRPAEAEFRFDVPLEDASLRWLWWRDGEFAPFTPPAVGEQIELPPIVLRWS